MQFARIESRLQNWENKNYQELQKLFVIVKACALLGAFVAAKMISFLVYLGYQVLKISIGFLRALVVGPVLVQRVSPQDRPLERHEFEVLGLETISRSWHG